MPVSALEGLPLGGFRGVWTALLLTVERSQRRQGAGHGSLKFRSALNGPTSNFLMPASPPVAPRLSPQGSRALVRRP